MNINAIRSLSDDQLLHDIEAAAANERHATARLIALLAEMDARRLYLQEGYSSLFVYCTRCLHLSEHAAYGRIEAARTARKFPVILDPLTDGSVTLTAVCLLSNHLTGDNHQQLLDAAIHKSRREVEEQVAVLRPMPPIPSAIRKLPKTEPATTPSLVRDFIVPSARDRMRHAVPDGDIAEIFDRAITLLLRNVERRFAEGGETTTENLQLRCRSHNAYEAREHFGFSLPTARGENHSSHTDVHDSGWRDRATLKRKCV